MHLIFCLVRFQLRSHSNLVFVVFLMQCLNGTPTSCCSAPGRTTLAVCAGHMQHAASERSLGRAQTLQGLVHTCQTQVDLAPSHVQRRPKSLVCLLVHNPLRMACMQCTDELIFAASFLRRRWTNINDACAARHGNATLKATSTCWRIGLHP